MSDKSNQHNNSILLLQKGLNSMFFVIKLLLYVAEKPTSSIFRKIPETENIFRKMDFPKIPEYSGFPVFRSYALLIFQSSKVEYSNQGSYNLIIQ